jgi:hypothetical protein
MSSSCGPQRGTTVNAHVARLREDASAVLRANGWRETTVDSADCHLAMVRVERTGERTVTTPDPRNQERPPRRGDASTKSTVPCQEPVYRDYPPHIARALFTEHKVGYSIKRRADGATRWWVLEMMGDDEAALFVARSTLELLLAVDDPR